jgi:hypothetical protein
VSVAVVGYKIYAVAAFGVVVFWSVGVALLVVLSVWQAVVVVDSLSFYQKDLLSIQSPLE